MPDTESHRRLYLVRHGEAKSKDEDPERGLTDAGRADVTRMAAWAATAGLQVDENRHSGKLRAKQTAEIFAYGPARKDDPVWTRAYLCAENRWAELKIDTPQYIVHEVALEYDLPLPSHATWLW